MTLFDQPSTGNGLTAAEVPEFVAMRDTLAARIARAEAAEPGHDPIGHRLDGHRACLAELDALIDGATGCTCPQPTDQQQGER